MNTATEPGAAVSTLPTLDAEVFYELHDGVCQQLTTLALLYDTFLNNAARLIAALQTAESSTLREKTLHALKGSAAMMGAARVARLAADLQQACATMRDDTLQHWIEQIAVELDETRRAVDARLASLATARQRN
jgi:HPt (histidine-containing phosphotransfer) domain-containing protein